MLRLALIACILSASAEAVDWRDSLTPPIPGKFPAPAPFKAVYRFSWSGIQAAKAECDFSRAAHGQFELDMTTRTTGMARTLWPMDAVHRAWCSASTLRPVRLRQIESYMGETLLTKTDFLPEEVRWTTLKTPSKDPPMREHKFQCRDVLDLQTGWLFVRSQRLEQGDHYRFVDFPGKGGYLVDVEVLNREKVKTPAATFDAIKCQVRIQRVTKDLQLEPHAKFRRAFGWVSDDAQRLLVKVQAEVFVGSVWCDLQSVEAP